MKEQMKIGLAIVNQRKIYRPRITAVIYDYDNRFRNIVDSYDFYTMLQLLPLNDAFVREVEGIRRKLKIPKSGYDFSKFVEKRLDLKGLEGEVSRLYDEYNMSKWITLNHKNIYSIILYNFVFPVFTGDIIHYEYIGEDSSCEEDYIDGINIKIIQPTKKGTILKYLRDNWTAMARSMKRIDKCPSVFMGNLAANLRIIELRDVHNMTFKQIATEMLNHSPYKFRCNCENEADFFRRRYDRAKERINNLFYKK